MASNTLIMSYVFRKFKKAPMIPLAAAEEPEP